jgi:hypothetical protein
MPQMPNVVAAAVQVYPNVVAAWILFLNWNVKPLQIGKTPSVAFNRG